MESQVNAEFSLLSCIMKNGDLMKEVTLNDNHFYDLKNKLVFNAMKKLDSLDEPIDVVTVKTQLGQELLMAGGVEYLSNLFNGIAKEENFKSYESSLINEYKVRKTKELSRQLNDVKSSRDLKVVTETINEINNVLEQGDKNEFNLMDTLLEIETEVNESKSDVSGVRTGFTELDMLLDGLNEGELTILGARPSVGKTAFALAITTNIVRSGHLTDFFSLEMSAKSLLYRMICSVGRINSMKMKNPRKWFNEKDWQEYRTVQGIIEKWKDRLFIHDRSNITVGEIRSNIRRTQRLHPNKRHVVVIDYLTLIQGSGRRERHIEVGEITRNLKRIARDLNVSIVLLAQLSRAVEMRKDKRPMLSDLRDSGEIEQDADKILFIHRDDYYDKESNNITEIILAKSRNGPVGTINLFFFKETQNFVSLVRE